MLEEFAIYALAVFIIVFMLVLYMDVIRRNNDILRSLTNETNTRVEERVTISSYEKPLVYPLYIDCSPDLVKSYLANNASEMNAMVSRPGA